MLIFLRNRRKEKVFSEHLEFFDEEAITFFCKSTGMFPYDLDYAYEVFQNNQIALFKEKESQQNRGKLSDVSMQLLEIYLLHIQERWNVWR